MTDEWKVKRVPGPAQRLDLHHDDATSTFDWPCERRDAHGPHKPEFNPDAPQGWDGNGGGYEECPGVAAHPAVMIGRTVKP